MSLFSNLNVGTRGLMASQMGMDITGQNIANADVEGYSRKRLNLAADYRYDSVHGQMGFGVEVINIERVRNLYIDQQIQKQNNELGIYEEIDHVFTSIENIFNEPTDTGIIKFVDDFFNSWENLSNNPADLAARTMVRTSGEILSDMFHNLSAELADLKSTRNDEIASRVQSVNKLSLELYNLNKEIASVEITNQNANDSRDRRDFLLKELSKIIETTTVENEFGQITVTTGGNILVSPVDYQELETTTATYTNADGSSYSEIGIRFAESKRIYTPTSGQMKGLFDARDKIIPEYQEYLDTFARDLATRINEQHLQGFNLHGYTGINFFDPTITGASDINVSASITTDVKNIAAAGNQSFVSASFTTTAGMLDFPNVTYFTADGNPSSGPADTDNVNDIVQGSVIVSVGSVVLQEGIHYNVNYRDGDIQMLTNGYDGNAVQIDFQYERGGFPGSGDNKNAIALGEMRHQFTMNADPNGNYTATFDQYYSSFIGQLGLEKNEATASLETREYLVQEYEKHQDSIAGVSLDEEMANLIKYQHTYQAAARIITTANQMLDVLMNI